MRLFPNEVTPGTAEHTAVAGALARAALELQNPKASPFGIDPLREASKVRLFLAMVIYKVKRGITNVLLKIVIRRVGTRAVARSVLPMIAVPVFAAWNAYTVWLVMREARIRALGGSAARELVDAAFTAFEARGAALGPAGKLATLRAVGTAIVRQQDLHPNVLVLLEELVRRVGEPEGEVIDDARRFLEGLPALPESERELSLRILEAAMLVDGRFTKRDQALYVAAHTAGGSPADVASMRARLRAFLGGESLR